MEDEEFTFRETVKERSITARSARNRRSHCGKGGLARFASDYMSGKEIKKMNGAVQTYDLSKPMSWAEFKALPDDIKVMYIDRIREKFGAVPTKQVSYMMACSDALLARELKRIGVKPVCKFGGEAKKIVYDKAAFYAWAGIVNQAEDVEEVPKPKEKPTQEPAPAAEATPEPVVQEQTHTIAPRSGEMVFEGAPADICESLVRLWGTEPVQVTVVFRRAGGYHG